MRKSLLALAAVAALGIASVASATDASAKGFGGGFKGGGIGKGFGGGFGKGHAFKGGWKHHHGHWRHRGHGYWGFAAYPGLECYNVIMPAGFVRTICE